jgi:quinol monooxygenase YgiN
MNLFCDETNRIVRHGNNDRSSHGSYGHFQAAPGYEEELRRQLHAIVDAPRGELGCMVYELHRDPENSAKFMFYEEFASQAALDDHLVTEHFRRFQSYIQANNSIVVQTVTRWRTFQ